MLILVKSWTKIFGHLHSGEVVKAVFVLHILELPL